jgi:hypothetical protein
MGKFLYTENEVNIKIEAKIEGQSSRTEDLVKTVAESYRLALSKNGYTLVEYHPSKYKFPFIYTNPNGKRFKTSLEHAKVMFTA